MIQNVCRFLYSCVTFNGIQHGELTHRINFHLSHVRILSCQQSRIIQIINKPNSMCLAFLFLSLSFACFSQTDFVRFSTTNAAYLFGYIWMFCRILKAHKDRWFPTYESTARRSRAHRLIAFVFYDCKVLLR